MKEILTHDVANTLVVILLLVNALLLGWVIVLHRKLAILRFCWIDMSDWTARHLESLIPVVGDTVEGFLNNILEESLIDQGKIDDHIHRKIKDWEILWRKQVTYHQDVMKRNEVKIPSERDYQLPLHSWYK